MVPGELTPPVTKIFTWLAPAPQVLAGAAPHVVHAVVAGERAAVAVVGGEAPAGHQQPRTGDDAGLDALAHVDVDEVLLAHDPHRGGAGGEILAEIPRRGQRLRHRAAAELAELVALARHDRGVAVAVDQPGHHEPVAEVEHLGPGRRGGADRR